MKILKRCTHKKNTTSAAEILRLLKIAQNANDSALPAKLAARALDKKYSKQQVNSIVLVQIGNHFIQFVMTFLVRPSTKATQPVLPF